LGAVCSWCMRVCVCLCVCACVCVVVDACACRGVCQERHQETSAAIYSAPAYALHTRTHAHTHAHARTDAPAPAPRATSRRGWCRRCGAPRPRCCTAGGPAGHIATP
jgi:hypothetical protein